MSPMPDGRSWDAATPEELRLAMEDAIRFKQQVDELLRLASSHRDTNTRTVDPR